MKTFINLLLIFTTYYANCQLFDYTQHIKQYWNYRYALNGDNIDADFYRWEPGFAFVGDNSNKGDNKYFCQKIWISHLFSFP